MTYGESQIRQYDPDRFLISLFAPVQHRAALLTLFAFNLEIAKTRETARETMVGAMRLQWWRDVIGGIYAGKEIHGNPLIAELRALIQSYELPQEPFIALIDARMADLEDEPPRDMTRFIEYAKVTVAPLHRLTISIAGEAMVESDIIKSAQAYGLTGLMRAVPFHARQGRCCLPAERMKAHGVSLDRLYALQPEEGLKNLVREIAERIESGKPQSKILRAAEGLSRIYLQQLRGAAWDVFSPEMAQPPKFKELRVWLVAL